MDDQVPLIARDVWLTSFWGFDPKNWGCVGFATEAKRDYFLKHSSSGTLMVIYVTKGNGPENMRGKVVGIIEVSHKTGNSKEFISGDRWAAKEDDPESRGKWLFAVKVSGLKLQPAANSRVSIHTLERGDSQFPAAN